MVSFVQSRSSVAKHSVSERETAGNLPYLHMIPMVHSTFCQVRPFTPLRGECCVSLSMVSPEQVVITARNDVASSTGTNGPRAIVVLSRGLPS